MNTEASAAVRHTSETFWQSLLYFNIYRILVSMLLLISGIWWPELRPLGIQYGGSSDWIVRAYLLLAVAFVVIQTNWHPRFNLLLTLEVVADIAILTALMHLSGGIQSGFSYMILVVLAGAGLVSHGRLTLFFAAVASMFVLSEHLYSMFQQHADISGLTFAGTICAGFFGTAILAHLLSKRVVASEALAKARGEQLASQVRINAQVIHDMHDGLLVADSRGEVIQSNPSAARLLGLQTPAGRFLGEISPRLGDAYFAWRQRIAADQFMMFDGEGVEVSRVRFVATGDSDNALIYMEDSARLRAEARQIKLAALGRLTANMAHEIRNPLAAISHAAELLGEESVRGISARLSHIIADNAGRLNRIVSDVLELGRRDRIQPEAIPLKPFLESLGEDLLMLNADHGGWVQIECDPAVLVSFDRSHLHRILNNLLSNSLRYASGKAGCVKLTATSDPLAAQVTIIVADDGPGIPVEAGGRIFEPFFTTHSQGTGLGLYIARELAMANNASLELLPSNAGALFLLTIRLN